MNKGEQDIAESNLLRRLAGPFARAYLVTADEGIFAVPLEDLYVGHHLRQTGKYSAPELDRLRLLCNSSTRLLEVGAHIGAFAIPLAKMCQSVTAIEANPESFELLELNAALNGLTNFQAFNKAAGNSSQPIEFLLSRINSAGSKRKPVISQPDYFYDHPQVMSVESARLDDLLAGQTFDVVLMDIEGSEYFALQGMPRILASAAALQVEFCVHHLKYVAAVAVEDFVSQIQPHFLSLCVPTRNIVVGRERFLAVLSEMFDRGDSDAGLVFFKTPPDQVKTPIMGA